jgi:hypothetical protein
MIGYNICWNYIELILSKIDFFNLNYALLKLHVLHGLKGQSKLPLSIMLNPTRYSDGDLAVLLI